jgi:large subunit ribosomal protein L10
LPITRAKKEELLSQYKEKIANSSAIVFTHYRGSSVKQQRSLRAKLKDVGAEYLIVKNSLLGIALKEVRGIDADALTSGPNGVVFVGEDIAKGVTALKDWIKAEKIIEITGAVLESSILNAESADKLSDLPTKEQVRAQLLGMLVSPASSLARIINAPAGGLARVINAHVEKQKEAA